MVQTKEIVNVALHQTTIFLKKFSALWTQWWTTDPYIYTGCMYMYWCTVCNTKEVAGAECPCVVYHHTFSLICFSVYVFWHCQAGNTETERIYGIWRRTISDFFFRHMCVHGVTGGGWLGTQSTINQPSLQPFLIFDRKTNRQVNHAHESGAAPLCLSCPMHMVYI
jgi:hypothetical protein